MFKKILIPLDGSELAEKAISYATDLAKCADAEIELLRVAQLYLPNYYFEAPIDAEDLIQRDRDEATSYITKLADQLKAQGFHVTSSVGQGPVADVIVDYAASTGADLIVMSTHGRAGVQRWLLGSVADRVLHGAKAPVLLVRAN
ncbi:MAG TPA: universal stress protein [Thermoflexales bacterium]|nr:universal stress protein [Thermoflexales bacterium]HQW36005.1 universal stress protein [Thermoflexales bacterium]HQX74720.1 universal stress protein [Thermoflexales bacterium]HQZ20875.1 universal stress protein [Thermoflexales bacterium]HQZ98682.1 universal stress protein [Thermoflexales bacterium]